jgi:hypothetical protein
LQYVKLGPTGAGEEIFGRALSDFGASSERVVSAAAAE